MARFRHILAPVDFGESSAEALALAIDLADREGAELTVLHAWEVPAYAYAGFTGEVLDVLTPVEDAARTVLEQTLRDVHARLPRAKAVLRHGVAWREVLAAAESAGADLIVMGTHGRAGLGRAFLGSVAEKVVRMSPVPVLTVRGARP